MLVRSSGFFLFLDPLELVCVLTMDSTSTLAGTSKVSFFLRNEKRCFQGFFFFFTSFSPSSPSPPSERHPSESPPASDAARLARDRASKLMSQRWRSLLSSLISASFSSRVLLRLCIFKLKSAMLFSYMFSIRALSSRS